jgi:hypothetical protein
LGPLGGDQGYWLASGEDGIPSPPDGVFVMVEIGRHAMLIHVEINDRQNQKLQSDFNKLCGQSHAYHAVQAIVLVWMLLREYSTVAGGSNYLSIAWHRFSKATQTTT